MPQEFCADPVQSTQPMPLPCFRREVQRYFPVPAGCLLEAVAKLSESYLAFELRPV